MIICLRKKNQESFQTKIINEQIEKKFILKTNHNVQIQRLPFPGPADDGVGVVAIELYQCLEFAHYQRVILPSPTEDMLEIELCICVAISTLNKKINFNIKTRILV